MRTASALPPPCSLALVLAAAAACGPSRGGADDDVERPIDARPPPPIDATVDAPPDARPSTEALPPDCLAAAERGLTWLTSQQRPDGSWGVNEPLAATAFAVLKLETYAGELGLSPFDPFFVYDARVGWGLDYLFRQATLVAIGPQAAGNPDSNGNGLGIRLAPNNRMYEQSIALMAIAAGGHPERIVTTAGSPLQGKTYKAVVEDAVDYLAAAQSDGTTQPFGCARGGWWYVPMMTGGMAGGDNSVTQWATLALEYARHPLYHYEVPTPDWVVAELRHWVACIQNHDGGTENGASGYDDPRSITNAYKTGALVQQLAFLGVDLDAPEMAAALAYLVRVWPDPGTRGWRSPPVSRYLAMYSIMKGMESMAITELGPGGIDWYRQFCDQLKLEQRLDGSWSSTEWDPDGSGVLSTEWALLTLERAAPPPEIIP
jgi:hypothetical protein